jgi:hypothetical protein
MNITKTGFNKKITYLTLAFGIATIWLGLYLSLSESINYPRPLKLIIKKIPELHEFFDVVTIYLLPVVFIVFGTLLFDLSIRILFKKNYKNLNWRLEQKNLTIVNVLVGKEIRLHLTDIEDITCNSQTVLLTLSSKNKDKIEIPFKFMEDSEAFKTALLENWLAAKADNESYQVIYSTHQPEKKIILALAKLLKKDASDVLQSLRDEGRILIKNNLNLEKAKKLFENLGSHGIKTQVLKNKIVNESQISELTINKIYSYSIPFFTCFVSIFLLPGGLILWSTLTINRLEKLKIKIKNKYNIILLSCLVEVTFYSIPDYENMELLTQALFFLLFFIISAKISLLFKSDLKSEIKTNTTLAILIQTLYINHKINTLIESKFMNNTSET